MQPAGPLPGLDVHALAGVMTLILKWCIRQHQLQGDVGTLQSGQHGLRQGPRMEAQWATGLHRRNQLRLRHIGHTEPGEVVVDQLVRLTLQDHIILLQGLIGWRHTHFKDAYLQIKKKYIYIVNAHSGLMITKKYQMTQKVRKKDSTHVSHEKEWFVNPLLLCWSRCICIGHGPRLSESLKCLQFSEEIYQNC